MPEKFWPERWLIAASRNEHKGATDETFVHSPAAFIPFSLGPANCPGRNLAMQQMRMAICLIMQKLEIRFAAGCSHDDLKCGIRDYLTLVKEVLPVSVGLRDKV